MDDVPRDRRAYRTFMEPEGLDSYRVVIGESDLFICTEGDLRPEAERSLRTCREQIEVYLASHVTFGTAFKPHPAVSGAPEIIKEMADAAKRFGVGPMATVAGAVAQFVGRDLLARSSEVIVENGGDLFMAGGRRRRVRIFAGSGSSVDVVVEDTREGIGLCTSSATVGPSVSLGGADAVTVMAPTAVLADAAATAFGNRVRSAADIDRVLEETAASDDIMAVVIIIEGTIGMRGSIELSGPT